MFAAVGGAVLERFVSLCYPRRMALAIVKRADNRAYQVQKAKASLKALRRLRAGGVDRRRVCL